MPEFEGADPLHMSAMEGMYDENPMMYDGMGMMET